MFLLTPFANKNNPREVDLMVNPTQLAGVFPLEQNLKLDRDFILYKTATKSRLFGKKVNLQGEKVKKHVFWPKLLTRNPTKCAFVPRDVFKHPAPIPTLVDIRTGYPVYPRSAS